LAKHFKKVTRTYEAGELIFMQGASANGIYSVLSGKVSVFKTVPAPSGPREIEIVKLGPGSIFGEMAMLGQTQRDASVRALEFTETVIITNDMFEDQMASLAPWVVNFVKILINRMRNTNERLAAAIHLLEANGIKPPRPD
jgi:CRP-like cAMP-binding protein